MNASSPSFQPLYLQIKGLLEGGLAAGEWRPGEPIPSEQDLAERFGVSQGTARKAIDALSAYWGSMYSYFGRPCRNGESRYNLLLCTATGGLSLADDAPSLNP